MSNPDKICFKVTIENGCIGVSFFNASLTASEFDKLIRKIKKLESEKQILLEGLKEISEISGRSEDVEITDKFGDIKILGLARYENRVIYAEHIANTILNKIGVPA